MKHKDNVTVTEIDNEKHMNLEKMSEEVQRVQQLKRCIEYNQDEDPSPKNNNSDK